MSNELIKIIMSDAEKVEDMKVNTQVIKKADYIIGPKGKVLKNRYPIEVIYIQKRGCKPAIGKKEFGTFENVRKSGITNMFDIAVVGELSGLSKWEVLEIMENHKKLKEKFGD